MDYTLMPLLKLILKIGEFVRKKSGQMTIGIFVLFMIGLHIINSQEPEGLDHTKDVYTTYINTGNLNTQQIFDTVTKLVTVNNTTKMLNNNKQIQKPIECLSFTKHPIFNDIMVPINPFGAPNCFIDKRKISKSMIIKELNSENNGREILIIHNNKNKNIKIVVYCQTKQCEKEMTNEVRQAFEFYDTYFNY